MDNGVRIPSPGGWSGQHGFTLVELLLAMVVGLVVTAGLTQVFTGARQSYRLQEELSRLQENGRFALDILSRDIRMAGFTGCASQADNLANVLNGGTGRWYHDLSNPMLGFEGGVSVFPGEFSASVRGNTDAIVVLLADPTSRVNVSTHATATATFDLGQLHDFQQGDILVASDCRQSTLFQMTNVNDNATVQTVLHAQDNALTPGNCTGLAGSPMDCGPPLAETRYQFNSDAFVARLLAHAYYVGEKTVGSVTVPVLNRYRLTASGLVQDELLEGIEELQILYGEDTDNDGTANRYLPAASVGLDMNRVVSVRVSLLLRTRGDGLATQPTAYAFNGQQVTPTDRRLRRVFTSTIALRNRAP